MRAKSLVPVLVALAGLATGPLAIPAAASDASATQAYLNADYALVRVADSHIRTSEAAPLEILANVKRQCPNAGAGSPQDPESTQMSNEVIGAMVLSAAQPDRQAIATFVRAVSGLSWGERSLTSAIHSYASKLHTALSLQVPDLCAQTRAWAAGGFQAAPAPTAAFDAKFMPAWVALGQQPAGLGRSESPATRALAHRAERLEEALSEAEARAVEHWGKIMNALNLWP